VTQEPLESICGALQVTGVGGVTHTILRYLWCIAGWRDWGCGGSGRIASRHQIIGRVIDSGFTTVCEIVLYRCAEGRCQGCIARVGFCPPQPVDDLPEFFRNAFGIN
jgi:hypothetical protein